MVLGIQDICHFTSRDIGYYPFNFQGYRILCSIFCVLSGILIFRKIKFGDICQFIRDTCLFTSRDMGYLVPPYTSLIGATTVKPAISRHSKEDFKNNYSLMQVKRVTESSILQYF